MAMKTMDIDRLRFLIRYSARSGLIRRAVDVRAGRRGTGAIVARSGDIAGTVSTLGYVVVTIDGVKYPAHRIGWAYTFGEWPDDEIDHINGVKTDNWMSNLRPADRAGNNRNCGVRSDNTSGFKGVTYRASTGRWLAQIGVDGRRLHLGSFTSAEEAALSYDAAAQRHFGEFARLNFPIEQEGFVL